MPGSVNTQSAASSAVQPQPSQPELLPPPTLYRAAAAALPASPTRPAGPCPSVPPSTRRSSPPPARPHDQRPTHKLSVGLLNTYKVINNVYFATRRKNQSGAIYNQGYDDEHGNYLVVHGEEINGRYLVDSMLGKGSFGVVVKVYDTQTQEHLALKIVKNKRVFTQQAQIEINLLYYMNKEAQDPDNIVKIYDHFYWNGHTVIAMELCFLNLFELLRLTEMRGVLLQPVALLCCDLLRTLRFLSEHKIIHCDVKPENILLRSSTSSNIRVIDFGSACKRGATMYNYIQTRFYRAPEVILGHSYSHGIDMWSLGLVVIEMHTGKPLLEGRTELEQLNKMVQVLGPLPVHMVNKAAPEKLKKYFFQDEETQEWKLRTVDDLKPLQTLEEVMQAKEDQNRDEMTVGQSAADYAAFKDIVRKMLRYDPEERIAPHEGLKHDFVTKALKREEQRQKDQPEDDSSSDSEDSDTDDEVDGSDESEEDEASESEAEAGPASGFSAYSEMQGGMLLRGGPAGYAMPPGHQQHQHHQHQHQHHHQHQHQHQHQQQQQHQHQHHHHHHHHQHQPHQHHHHHHQHHAHVPQHLQHRHLYGGVPGRMSVPVMYVTEGEGQPSPGVPGLKVEHPPQALQAAQQQQQHAHHQHAQVRGVHLSAAPAAKPRQTQQPYHHQHHAQQHLSHHHVHHPGVPYAGPQHAIAHQHQMQHNVQQVPGIPPQPLPQPQHQQHQQQYMHYHQHHHAHHQQQHYQALGYSAQNQRRRQKRP
eukprot:TRINITY_DN51310_c0_g1_i1.p1 TRINITY_DN51310_c0_g1~~TRINITY_DN51310_c0_g1_i1.p1  ORF type:complete len:847 (+),score=107.13 TRINITY_DN51310_c0_g1_i1:275-2542(+)